MLQRIIRFSVHNRIFILLAVACLVIFGIEQAFKLSIDAVPDITNNQVQVITRASSYGTNDIERLVTFPIEQICHNIPGLIEIRSISRFGLSLITLVFDDDVDIYWARSQVFERLSLVKKDIPNDINVPELGPVSSGLGEIYQYTINKAPEFKDKYDDSYLRTIQDWIIRRQLLAVKGVADVSSFGGKLKQYEVSLNMGKLQYNNISISEIIDAVEKNNLNTGGSYINNGETILFIRTEGLVKDLKDLGKIFIKQTKDNIPIFLEDVAEMKYGFAPRYGALSYRDEGEAVGGVVLMVKGSNSSQTVSAVKKKVLEINNNLPAGLSVEAFLDRSKMVNNSINTVKKNLIEGAIVVIIVLIFFLGNLTAGLIVASIIPLSFLFTIIMMNIFGISGNLMSLGAIDFGLIIDGSIIIVESIFHQIYIQKRRTNLPYLTQPEMNNLVESSSSKMMKSTLFGQFIILIVYLPIFFLSGIEGKMFRPMAITVVFALLGAFILTLTYIPMMTASFINKNTSFTENFSFKLFDFFSNIFEKMLRWSIKKSKWVISIVIILFIYTIFEFQNLGGEFIPTLEEGDFAVEMKLLPGTNLETTIEVSQRVAHILIKEFPDEVENIVSKLGSSEIPTDPMPIESGDIIIVLKPISQWKKADNFDELADKMHQAVNTIPGIKTNFQYPVQMRFNELMTGAKQDIVCKIYGEDLDSLVRIANEVSKIIEKVPGHQSIIIEAANSSSQIVIKYNREALAEYNISVEQVNNVINTCFAGKNVGIVLEGEKRFDLVLRLSDELRNNFEDVENISVNSPNNVRIPLSLLADISIKNSPSVVERENANRRVSIGFNVRNRDVKSMVEEVKSKIENQFKFPPGYYMQFGGTFENLENARERLKFTIPISLALILFLLYLTFNSISKSLIIYTAIPLSIIGGVWFLKFRDMPFSVSAAIGFIALFGICVLNGIVLITEFNFLRKQKVLDIVEAVIIGTKSRFKPVVMTATVAALGFFPMALSTSAGSEVQRPLATVVIGGLILATFLTLFIIPILYLYFEINKPRHQPKSKTKNFKLPILFIIILILPFTVYSQVHINFKNSLDSVTKTNKAILLSQMQANYKKLLIGTSTTIDPTKIGLQIGQISSHYTDKYAFFNQEFRSQKYYKIIKDYLTSDYKLSNVNTFLQSWNIKKEIAQVFYHILVINEKINICNILIKNLDTLNYKLKLEAKNGQVSSIETIKIQNSIDEQVSHINVFNQDKLELEEYFKLLLHSTKNYILDYDSIIFPTTPINLSNIESHPLLQMKQSETELSKKQIALDKLTLKPSFILGGAVQSFEGYVFANKISGPYVPYYILSAEISLPIFNKGHKSKIIASQYSNKISQENYENEKYSIIAHNKTLYNLQILKRKNLDFYKSHILANNKMIYTFQRTLFLNGEIHYDTYLESLLNYYTLEMKYLEEINNYNDIAIELFINQNFN